MKKLLLVLIVMFTVSCESGKDVYGDIQELKEKRRELWRQNLSLKEVNSELAGTASQLSKKVEILNFKKDGKKIDYVLKLKLKQSRISLSISSHIKDAANAITFELPVSEEFYSSVHIGDDIVDDFRMGSLVLNGSLSSWNMRVVGKRTNVR